ncbi:potassium transporter TrkG [Thioclava electrotropha]|uniref:potassium transporter TrkG n=1 Tax=Thioclava electrotropha TaxID=1549850 RepID=UPI003F726C2D
MTDPQIALMMLGLFIVFVFLGFPIAFTLMAMGIGFGYYAYFDAGRMWRAFNRLAEDSDTLTSAITWVEGAVNNRIFDLFINQTYTVMSNEVLTAVPLFLFIRHWIAALEVRTPGDFGAIFKSIWGSLFTSLSFLTTTGFESSAWHDARDWSGLGTPGLILAGLAIIGGGVATTAGGVRLLRVYALLRHGERELDKLIYPNSIAGGGMMARRLRREGAYISWIVFMLFAISIGGVMMAVSLFGLSFEPATILTIAALSNTGPLAGIAADVPLSWAHLSEPIKAIFAFAMVLGRLETLAIIALFNPEFWRS